MIINTSNLIGVSGSDLPTVIINIINWLINFSAVLSVVMIIISGFQFIVSGGDQKKIAKATSALIFSIIGLILVFISPLVIQFVIDNFLGK